MRKLIIPLTLVFFFTNFSQNLIGEPFSRVVKMEKITSDTLVTALKNIKIFPNPAREHFYIKDNHFKTLHMQIYNSIGKLIDSQIIHKENTIYNSSFLPSGLYIIRLAVKSESDSRKLIIIR